MSPLVLPFLNTVTFAEGAFGARSRREEEAMQGHRRRRETKTSPATLIRPKGWGGTGPSSCCFSSPMALHRLVVAPRSGLRRAPNKRHRIYESEYLVSALLNTQFHQDSFAPILLCPRLLVHTSTHKEKPIAIVSPFSHHRISHFEIQPSFSGDSPGYIHQPAL